MTRLSAVIVCFSSLVALTSCYLEQTTNRAREEVIANLSQYGQRHAAVARLLNRKMRSEQEGCQLAVCCRKQVAEL